MLPNSWKKLTGNNLEVETAVLIGFKAKDWEAALRLQVLLQQSFFFGCYKVPQINRFGLRGFQSFLFQLHAPNRLRLYRCRILRFPFYELR